MPRQRLGVLHALLRRENGSSLANDQRDLLSYVEERTAATCFKEKNCQLSGSPRSTFLVTFSHDRSKMASTHGDHTIRVVDSFTGQYVRTLRGHPRTPWCIAFHPSNNNLLASGCLGGEVRIWDLMGGCEVYTPPDRAVIASLAFHPIDHVLLVATSNKLYFWQWEQPHPFVCLQTNYLEEKVRLVKFSPFGDYILTGITNCSHVEPNAQQSRTQASLDQVLQSVSCTQLDSDQVTEYIMQQTSAHAQRTRDSNPSEPSSQRDTTEHEVDSRPGLSVVASNSSSTTTSSSLNSDTPSNAPDAQNSGTRPMRNYRGVFALFRARDTGGWNMDTSEVDGDPTDVGRSNVLFSGTTTESMSVDRVEPTTTASSHLVHSGSPNMARATTGSPQDGVQWPQETASGEGTGIVRNPSSSSPPLTSSVATPAWSSSQSSSSSTSSSSSSRYSENTSTLASILQEDHDASSSNTSEMPLTTASPLREDHFSDASPSNAREMPRTTASPLREDLLQPTANESVLSATVNDDVSQSISILPINPSTSDVSVTMDTTTMEATDSDYVSRDTRSSGVNASVAMDTAAMETADSEYGSRSVTSSAVNVQIGGSVSDDSSSNPENSERYVSGVGSVVNVGGGSSRTSYVAHGSNYSSSLSTLSNQEGSGTAIATATARTFRHVHTAVVIANGNERGPQIALRTAINRAIAGAFAGSGEGAVASNIINTTHRLQWWDFSKCDMPDIKNVNTNVIVPCCKIHNDASCDLSADGTLLAAFVPSALGFPDDGMLAVYSMKKGKLGQCLYTKKFGPNAISISISPLNSHVVVGLAARRIHWHLTSQQMMAQVFKLKPDKNSEHTFTELKSPVHSIVLSEEESERRTYVSVNAAFWHPVVGCGLVYGTNRGDLRMRQFGLEP